MPIVPRAKWFLVPLLVTAACGSDGRPPLADYRSSPSDDAGAIAVPPPVPDEVLRVEPRTAVLFLDTAAPMPSAATQKYRVLHRTSSGYEDVTSTATFGMRNPAIGAFAGDTFTSVAQLPAGVDNASSTLTVDAAGETSNATITVVAIPRSGEGREFFFVVPLNQAPSPASDVLPFTTRIQAADVAFVMDTTGSMGSAIGALKTQLTASLLGRLQAAIPSVGLAVVSHRDESDDAELVSVKQPVTTVLADAQAAVKLLGADGGGDGPEGQIAAMFHVLTGAAVGVVPKHVAPAPRRGGADFRPGALPVIVLISDASWHDPSGGQTAATLASAFSAASARFVALTPRDQPQAEALADATRSLVPPKAFVGCATGQCCTGIGGAPRRPTGPGGTCRLEFIYDEGAPVIGPQVADAITAIATGSMSDISARPRNDPANPDRVDATSFIRALRAMEGGDAAQGCPPLAAKDTDKDGIKDTFIEAPVGTRVCFEVLPAVNTRVVSQDKPRFFKAFIDVQAGSGGVSLDTHAVRFMVPPKPLGAN